MILEAVFERFVRESPVSVMFRGTLENVLSPERLDRLFEETAGRQYCRTLLFSTCAEMLGLVVAQIHPSLHAVYRQRCREVGVSVKALYDKLARVEPAVCERLVRQTAGELALVCDQLAAPRAEPLKGYQLRIADGNHLAGTEHRLRELRRLGPAALPGQALAVLDPQRGLIEDVVLEPDGHANERTLLPRLLEKVQARQCWIDDRSFCTTGFLFGIAAREAFFIIRQHGQLVGQAVGRRRKLGRSETGLVYEQPLQITDAQGRSMLVRRITVELDQPTRDGQHEIHLLTNLPAEVSGRTVARVYRQRWTIELAFEDLALALRSEIATLGYPAAALFGFCLGVVLYNVLAVVRAALQAVSGRKRPRTFSAYYLADEIAGVWRGMAIAIPDEHWEQAFATLRPSQLAQTLLALARQVRISQFTTNPSGPKRPPPKRKKGHWGSHVATHRLLQKRSK